jgi:hypothetical protein
MASKQTAPNNEAPGHIPKLFGINRFWKTVKKIIYAEFQTA